jgi:short-subunit dehydrogenase
VDVLVNDAGVGGHGRFATERQLAMDLAMIQLNVTTLVELTGCRCQAGWSVDGAES